MGYIFAASLFFTILFNSAYAQTTGDQTTLSGDLQNNPVAQDILKKIEQSKKWIVQIEKKNFETSQRQLELEQKRAEVLQSLKDDLRKWEEIWGYYTFDSMLERALENHPAKDTDSIYDHPLKFTASKIDAGREALQKVILDGGSPEQARDAFVKAAKITRAEMLSANTLYNVLHNNAYYNQQVLFESNGKFDYELSGEELRKYYQDFRTNPEYLDANPFDSVSWEDLSKTNPSTECRPGHTLVYRIHASDYVCTTEYTAEMWVRHGMGKLVTENFVEKEPVDIKKLDFDRISKKVENLNSRIQNMQEHYEKKIHDTKLEYKSLFSKISDEQKQAEQLALQKFNNSQIKQKQLSQEITEIREKYSNLEEGISTDQTRIMKILEEQHVLDMDDFVRNYQHDSELKLVWNFGIPTFEMS
ncbi:MAG: hypothetical protein ACE5Q9_04855 [Nitrosopumilus sp.]